MQIRLSYEEKIINALGRLSYKRDMKYLQKAEMQFQSIREVLQPLYNQVRELEDEKKYEQSRRIAMEYASMLHDRLEEHRLEDRGDFSKTSVKHLIWMCRELIDHTGYVPNEWSITKLHRWIGYIQGVMTARGFTTVEREREDYKACKARVLNELSLPNQEV